MSEIPVSFSSLNSGLCEGCPHFVVGNLCNTSKRCGQIMACRCQSKAKMFGRYPSGRVRSRPLKVREKRVKPSIGKWVLKREELIALGDAAGLTWIGLLSATRQTMARRFVKRGVISAYYLPEATIRSKPVLYIKLDEFLAHYRSWGEYTGKEE